MTTEEPQRPDTVRRIVASILLAWIGRTGLPASLSGGYFTLSFPLESVGAELLNNSLPGLLIGEWIARVCSRGIRRPRARQG